MEISSSSRDLFLTGKVKVLEKRLLDETGYNRLIECGNVEDFLSGLSDTPYRRFIEKSGIEMGFKNYISGIYKHLRTDISQPIVLDIFMFKNDIASFISSTKKVQDEELYAEGVFGKTYRKDEVGSIPFFKDVQIRLNKISPHPADGLIEKVCMDIIDTEYVCRIKNPLIRKYYSYSVDVKNLLRNVHQAPADYYWAGGNMDVDFWKNVSVRDGMPARLKVQPYIVAVAGVDNYENWEIKLKSWLGRFLKDMRKISLGVEPVVSYLLCLMEESVNLILIYTGVKMHLEASDIKRRLNLSYV